MTDGSARNSRQSGWTVHERQAPGSWPEAGTTATTGLARLLADIPDGAVVLVDGLIASAVPDVLLPEADRLRLVILVHMPLGAGLVACTAGGNERPCRPRWPWSRPARGPGTG